MRMFRGLLALSTISLLSFLFASGAHAATFSLSPSSQSFTQGCDVSVNVLMNTSGVSTNAVDAVLFFDPSEVDIVDQNASIPGIQVGQGNLYQVYAGNIADPSLGKIMLTAFNVVGGYTGSGTYGTIVFRSKPGVTSTQFAYDFTPGSSLDSNIADLNSADVLSSVSNANFTFTPGSCIPDTQPPQVTQFAPAHNADNIPLSTNVSFHLTDNQSGVDLNSVSVTVHGTVYNTSSPLMTISGTALDSSFLINPAADFPFNQEVVTVVTARDLSGNVMSPQVFRFNPPDTQAPNVTNVQPAHGSRNIPLSSNISFRITDNDSGVDMSTFQMTVNGEGFNQSSPQISVSGSALSYDVILNPSTDFPFNTQITFIVQVSDLGGNVMSPATFSFNSPDQSPPDVTNLTPSNGSVGAALDANVEFNIVDNDTGVDLTSVLVNLSGADYSSSSPQVSVSGTGLNYRIVLNPDQNFSFGQQVSLSVAARDVAGNVMPVRNFSFTVVGPPPGCGNAVREGSEQCDDGNLLDGDGCSATCTQEPICGDGRVEGAEECEPAGSVVCDSSCRVIVAACFSSSAAVVESMGFSSFVPSAPTEVISDSFDRFLDSVGLAPTPEVVDGVRLEDVETQPFVCDDVRSEQVEASRTELPYTPPEGYELVRPSFALNCAPGPYQTTLAIPQQYADVRAVRCVGGQCSDVEFRQSQRLMCGQEVLFEEEAIEPESALLELTALELPAGASDYQVDALEEGSSSRYVVQDLLSERVLRPHNSLRLVSQPLQVVRLSPAPAGSKEMVRFTMPLITDPTVISESVRLYALDATAQKWSLVHDGYSNGDQIRVEFDYASFSDRDGSGVFALMGVECEGQCQKVSLANVYQPISPSRAAVVLVHGLGTEAKDWSTFLEQIRRTRQPYQVWSYQYPVEKGVTPNALDFARQMEAQAGQFDSVMLVAHSIGGLVAQEALTLALRENTLVPGRYTFLSKVNRVILMGTPNDPLEGEEPVLAYYDYLLQKKSGSLFIPSASLLEDLTSARPITPKVPGVEYFVIAGNKPFGNGSSSVSVGDGLVSQASAQRVGVDSLSDQCGNYFEVDADHVSLITNPRAQKILGQLITENLRDYLKDQALLGYEQYYQLALESCRPNDRFLLIGRKVDERYADDGIQCSCGNNYCGEGEDAQSCPGDCAGLFLPEYYDWLFWILLLAVVIGSTYVIRKIWKKLRGRGEEPQVQKKAQKKRKPVAFPTV